MDNGLLLKYFVLKPAGDDAYARASRFALIRYADEIRSTNEQLSDDLLAWAAKETLRSQAQP